MDRREFLVGTAAVPFAAVSIGANEQGAAAQARSGGERAAQVLVFDTFGTVVDWRSSVIAEGTQLGKKKGLTVDWSAFADAWRGGDGPALGRGREGGRAGGEPDTPHPVVVRDPLWRLQN